MSRIVAPSVVISSIVVARPRRRVGANPYVQSVKDCRSAKTTVRGRRSGLPLRIGLVGHVPAFRLTARSQVDEPVDEADHERAAKDVSNRDRDEVVYN
jgi:hypothetical protein